MADRFPPLAEMPPELANIEGLKHDAEWAQTFAPSTTSLAQRYRQNQSINAYAGAVQAQHEAALQANMMRDTAAQNFYFKGKKLEMDEQSHRAAMSERDQRMQFAREMFPMNLAAKEAQTRAALAREKATTAKVIQDAEDERMAQEDTAGLLGHISELRGRGINERHPDWASGVAVGVDTFRNAEPDLRKKFAATVLKGQEVEKMTPEQISEKVAALQTAQPGQQFRMNAAGDTTVNTIVPKTAPNRKDPIKDTAALFDEELASVVEQLGGKEKVPAEVWKAFEDRKLKLKTDLAKPGAVSAPDANPRLSLAQKALSDPNASEAHKAAARKILGQ